MSSLICNQSSQNTGFQCQTIEAAFKEFMNEYEFEHVTSSPKFPQTNGMAELAVKTVKLMLEKNDGPCLTMMV